MDNVTVSGIVGLAVILFILVAVITAAVEVVDWIKRRFFRRERSFKLMRVHNDSTIVEALVDDRSNILHIRWLDKE